MSDPIKTTAAEGFGASTVRSCPVCGKEIALKRYGKSYWQARCEIKHLGSVETSACPMRTKKDAWRVWDENISANTSVSGPCPPKKDDANKNQLSGG